MEVYFRKLFLLIANNRLRWKSLFNIIARPFICFFSEAGHLGETACPMFQHGIQHKGRKCANFKDSDGDGVSDINDAFPNNPAGWLDTDKDGTGNNADQDDDNDGMLDSWKIANALNPLVNDANLDKDLDGFTNIQEYYAGTNPNDRPIGSKLMPWLPILLEE